MKYNMLEKIKEWYGFFFNTVTAATGQVTSSILETLLFNTTYICRISILLFVKLSIFNNIKLDVSTN